MINQQPTSPELNMVERQRIRNAMNDLMGLTATHKSHLIIHSELMQKYAAQQKDLAVAREALDLIADHVDAPTGSAPRKLADLVWQLRDDHANALESIADAICQPKGVVPKSADGLLTLKQLDDAEQRRKDI